MNHNIIPSLIPLAEPIEKLKPLPGNPHRGDVEAMKSVLSEFGQHRPVVGQGTSEEGGFSLVGNTMTEAARQLGWTHIAVAWVQEDNAAAMARALSDNLVATMGVDDPRLMSQAMEMVVEDFYDVFDSLGFDDFEMAALSQSAESFGGDTGYIAPELIERPTPGTPDVPRPAPEDSTPSEPTPKPDRKAVVQYSLVFDDNDQQRRWHDFVRHIRSDAEVSDHDTTAAKLIAWLEERADF